MYNTHTVTDAALPENVLTKKKFTKTTLSSSQNYTALHKELSGKFDMHLHI